MPHRGLGAQVLSAALGDGTDVLYLSPLAMPVGPEL
jgi:hypothetical protein